MTVGLYKKFVSWG